MHVNFNFLFFQFVIGARLLEAIVIQNRTQGIDFDIYCLHRSQLLSYVLSLDIIIRRKEWPLPKSLLDDNDLINPGRDSSGQRIL